MDQIRTSKSHPLRIDNISLPETGGQIGMTLCPGKCGRSTFGYTWQRDMDADMQVVLDWGADIVVTLMETDELQLYHAGNIGDLCSREGIEWHHLPIRDVDIPDKQFGQLWTYSGFKIRSSLKRGKSVLVHCRGGLGRTGTIVARLLIELGWDSGTAIKTIHTVRPGTIETKRQEDYTRSCLPVQNRNDDKLSRTMGCLFGGAIGDGLGYLVEFDDIDKIKGKYGKHGVTNPVSNDRITVSDDTQMTLFTLEGLLRAEKKPLGHRIDEVRNAYLDWFYTQAEYTDQENIAGHLAFSPALRVNRAPGNTCLSALNKGGNGSLETPINNSKGCGSVMRVAPIGLLASEMRGHQVFKFGMQTGALTHGHITSSLAAGAMALMIFGLMEGKNLLSAAHSALELLNNHSGHEEVSRAIRRAIEYSEKSEGDYPEMISHLWGDTTLKENSSRGWVAEEALAIGLYSALIGGSYSEVIQIAATHSGDSDSTASIAGQLYGTWKGANAIPGTWISKLDVLKEILSLTTSAMYTNRDKEES